MNPYYERAEVCKSAGLHSEEYIYNAIGAQLDAIGVKALEQSLIATINNLKEFETWNRLFFINALKMLPC
jgi:hypothetical protein